MWFKVNKISKKRKYTKKTSYTWLYKILWYGFLGLFILLSIGGIIFYNKIVKTLPSIDSLSQMQIKESSVIYDRKQNPLYTLYGDEKRTYINYDMISPNMINALVAWEDKRYWENPWIDIIWLLRAGFYWVIGKNSWFGGTSTLTQQLIRNTIIENRSSRETFEEKITRKIKELILAYRLTNGVSKQKILELYLNKIPFGSNAYGIEQASLTFFGKQAKDLDILESSILASIPKWPTFYSPYNYYTRLVGNLFIYPKWDENSTINLTKKADLNQEEIASLFTDFISNLEANRVWDNGIRICNLDKIYFKNRITIDGRWCSVMNYSELFSFLNSLVFEKDEKKLEYEAGRKDFILWRMLEDEYIDFEQYKDALLASIGFEFKPYREDIKYPHFVMYIRDYLSQKYGEEILEEGWLQIYTTLDPDLQEKAQALIVEQVAYNKKQYDGDNAALVSIDNSNGDILAYVGWADYFNNDIDGKVNMITAKRQPWSSFKPYVYALAIDKNPFGTQTPIYDVPTTFPGWYAPQNYDRRFSGKMTFMTALNHSRNIPAVKAYFLAWEQTGIINYLETVGVTSLNKDFSYGAPLSLWTGEMTPLEMAMWYSVFANMGSKIEINPILKILDNRWLVIEEKKEPAFTRVLNEKTAYIMNYILSATYSRPDEFWNTNLSLKDRQAWAKTGTSNKSYVVNGQTQLFPWDLWTAGYTPQFTTIVWAGNTNGKALKQSADGLNGAAPIWKKFMEYAHEGKEKLTWKMPEWMRLTKVSKISWLLAPEGFDPKLTIDALFTNIPTEYDTSLQEIQVDMLCNGKVGPLTPPEALKTWYHVAYHSVDPKRTEWENGVQKWAKENGYSEYAWIGNIITDYTDQECKRDPKIMEWSTIQISSSISNNEIFVPWYNHVEIWYKSSNPLSKIQVFLWSNFIQEIPLSGKTTWVFAWGITIPAEYSWEQTLTLQWIDSYFISWKETKTILIWGKDTTPPIITITNPERDTISLYEDQYFNLRGTLEDRSKIRVTNIYINWVAYKMGIEWREFAVEINSDNNLEIGIHEIKIEAVDLFFNTSQKIITLEILPR